MLFQIMVNPLLDYRVGKYAPVKQRQQGCLTSALACMTGRVLLAPPSLAPLALGLGLVLILAATGLAATAATTR